MRKKFSYDLFYKIQDKRVILGTPVQYFDSESDANARSFESIRFYINRAFIGAQPDSFEVVVKAYYL
jgi:hypothetical protein